MATVIDGDFEWDSAKAESNLAKHGVTFEEGESAVLDERAVFVTDEAVSAEERFRVIGMSMLSRVLLVVLVERGERDRIISARPATRAEEEIYHGEYS